MELFQQGLEARLSGEAPLADRMRPRSIAEFVGQEHLLGPAKILQRIIDTGEIPSLLLWGPPGCGKTSLARLLATTPGYEFVFFSAVLSGVKEVRDAIEHAKTRRAADGTRTVLFVDEIHRFNKAQQDAFLPHVESGLVTLIGATTENPSFEINSPLLSRCRVLTLMPLTAEELLRIVQGAVSDAVRGVGRIGLAVEEGALEALAGGVDGDARVALNALEVAVRSAARQPPGERRLTRALLAEALGGRRALSDRGGEEHYNLASAFIKSLRASDPDAALYWMARMLEAGEDPHFLLRRLVIFAAEDVGNADPQALPVATAALAAFDFVGLPEGWIPMAQAATYLAAAPKSKASYRAYVAAREAVTQGGNRPVPAHLRNAPTGLMKSLGYGKGYADPHEHPEGLGTQSCLPEGVAGGFYRPTDRGQERAIGAYLERVRAAVRQAAPRPPASKPAARRVGST